MNIQENTMKIDLDNNYDNITDRYEFFRIFLNILLKNQMNILNKNITM